MCICVLTLLLLLVVFLLPLRLKVASSYHQNTCFWKSSIQSAISNPGYFIIVSIVEVNHMNQSLRKVHGWPEKANSQLRQSTFLEKSMIEKRSVFFLAPKKGNAKECSNYPIIAFISHASKVMLKIPQARLQQYVKWELSDVQSGFRKGRGTRDQIASVCWIIEKSKRVPENHLVPVYWLCQSLWLCGSQKTVENSERDGNTSPPYLPPEKSVCRSRSNS